MFEKPTVFILGAGASWHYSYPTGEHLVKRILEKTVMLIRSLNELRDIYGDQIVLSPPKFFIDNMPLRSTYGDYVKFFQNFYDRLRSADPPVIDYFLGWNQDLKEIGRFMISWVILDSEREHKEAGGNYNRQRAIADAAYADNRRIGRIENFSDNWYRFILYKILSGCNSQEDVFYNRVSFITFNYDTSLERFLYQGLRSIKFRNGSFLDFERFLEGKFIHVYGLISEDPYSKKENIIRNFGFLNDFNLFTNDLDFIYDASKGIRTIEPDNKTNNDVLGLAHDLLVNAEEVYILGYGFDPQNNKRLKLKDSLSYSALREQVLDGNKTVFKNVYFSNYGDKNSVNKRVGKLLLDDPGAFLQDKPKIDFSNQQVNGSLRLQYHYEKSIKDVYGAIDSDFDFI